MDNGILSSDVDNGILSSDVACFYHFSYLTIFYSFLQNHILNTNFYQLHPSHRRDAYNKHPHWTAAFRNKIWYIWVWICLEFYEKARKMKKKYWEVWNANEKANKMKKAFCFDICSCHYLRQNLPTSDLRFSQVTSVEKKETSKTFLSLGLWPRLQKLFSQYPFFYFG